MQSYHFFVAFYASRCFRSFFFFVGLTVTIFIKRRKFKSNNIQLLYTNLTETGLIECFFDKTTKISELVSWCVSWTSLDKNKTDKHRAQSLGARTQSKVVDVSRGIEEQFYQPQVRIQVTAVAIRSVFDETSPHAFSALLSLLTRFTYSHLHLNSRQGIKLSWSLLCS